MSMDLLVFLAAAVVCVPIAKRLGLGSILGYLVAGALIGPSVFALVQGGDSVQLIAELGVVLMLFTIGLELDVKHLWDMRLAVFGGGAIQLVYVGLACGLALLALGFSWSGALVAGLALALSSTAIAVQTMNDRGLSKTPMGRTSFAVLLFQDIAAIPLLALVPVLDDSGAPSTTPAWLSILKAVGAFGIVFVVGRYLSRPLLRPIAATGVREIFTAFALLLVLGVGELMHLAGLSMALGAFLAGVLLASSEYRHALESDIEPFKGLLLGLFFMAVGMQIELSLFATHPLEVLGTLVGFVFIKLLALLLVAKRLHIDPRQRWLFAALIGQGGEFAFVVFGAAGQTSLMDPEWGRILTLTVALSMATTPLLLLWHDRLAARHADRDKRAFDDIEDDGAEVVIAGFGRIGQIVGRLLFASGMRGTVLDHDPDQIDFLRRFGFRVFYGDATRLDLLEKAGIAHAKVLVLAIDDVEASLTLAEEVRRRFPRVEIVARARNVGHYASLRRLGVRHVERETFESSLRIGRRALEALGCPPYEARERADKFRRHNVSSLEALIEVWDDEQTRIQLAKQAREQLEEQFERDRQSLETQGVRGWHAEREPRA